MQQSLMHSKNIFYVKLCSYGEILSVFANSQCLPDRQISITWSECLRTVAAERRHACLVSEQRSVPRQWVLLILLQSLVIHRRDIGHYLEPGNCRLPAGSNKISITTWEWRLGKINNVCSLDVDLLMCCYPKLSLFSQ